MVIGGAEEAGVDAGTAAPEPAPGLSFEVPPRFVRVVLGQALGVLAVLVVFVSFLWLVQVDLFRG